MYAVIESGGKQYRVELGAEIQVDRLDAHPGDAITLDRVLLVADGDSTAVGQPVVDGASVSAHVLRQERGDKIVVFKYKPKARSRVKKGHRAELTILRIADIAFGGRSAVKDAEQAESRKSKAARDAEQQAQQKAAADRELAAKLASAAPATTEAPGPGTKRATKRTGARDSAAAPEPSGATAEAETDARTEAATSDVAADEATARAPARDARSAAAPPDPAPAESAEESTDSAEASADDTDTETEGPARAGPEADTKKDE